MICPDSKLKPNKTEGNTNMLKKTAFRTVPAALVLMLGACSWFQQPAAPVTAGTASGASAQGNPYGAAPYDPNAAEAGAS